MYPRSAAQTNSDKTSKSVLAALTPAHSGSARHGFSLVGHRVEHCTVRCALHDHHEPCDEAGFTNQGAIARLTKDRSVAIIILTVGRGV